MTSSRHLAFQSKQQPIFTFRVFQSWPSKPAVTDISDSIMNGKPKFKWTSMQQLFLCLYDDIEIEIREKNLLEYKQSIIQEKDKKNKPKQKALKTGEKLDTEDLEKDKKVSKNKLSKIEKLDNLGTAYDYGYKYPEYALKV